MDVINAAKKISEAGIQLDKLAKQIADQVLVKYSVSLNIFFCLFKSTKLNIINKERKYFGLAERLLYNVN